MEDDSDELEGAYDRSELAALFEELTTAFGEGRPAAIDGDGRRLAFETPDRASVELELERKPGEDDDRVPPTVEFEIELEWDDERPASDASTERGADDASAERGEADASSDAGESAPDDEPTGGGASDVDRSASIPDESQGGIDGRRARYEVYRDRADEWRWRLVHWNGNVIADSGEGYTSKYNAERAVRSVVRNAPTATVEHLD